MGTCLWYGWFGCSLAEIYFLQYGSFFTLWLGNKCLTFQTECKWYVRRKTKFHAQLLYDRNELDVSICYCSLAIWNSKFVHFTNYAPAPKCAHIHAGTNIQTPPSPPPMLLTQLKCRCALFFALPVIPFLLIAPFPLCSFQFSLSFRFDFFSLAYYFLLAFLSRNTAAATVAAANLL